MGKGRVWREQDTAGFPFRDDDLFKGTEAKSLKGKEDLEESLVLIHVVEGTVPAEEAMFVYCEGVSSAVVE